ncbi:hypothetical protein QBC35DRAFT_388516 [Podospora australis]|uniref:FAD-binding PCMH-type domain-containing protein n=1 Tax=Podospora australis TaxID=1536484 RepID=A0AAN6WR31_9PEZI|nr:hypothetical protein QBC35DRAFT_388516 [Podospora australis]
MSKLKVAEPKNGGGGLTTLQRLMVAWTSVAVLVGAAWLSLAQAGLAVEFQGIWPRTVPRCRCYPGESCWPSTADWTAFNKTIGGRLIATVPIGAVCHDTFPGVGYDAARCAEIQGLWPKAELHEETTHSVMAAFWSNNSCDPFTSRDSPCEVGSYVQFAVNAANADHYKKTIAFAAKNNIRLVIRNTGHDYMGKSTGAGGLALWTHNIKDRSIIDYKSSYYTGKAMKIGAGVSAGEAQETANAKGLLVVDGDCPTVGIAGGYTQGGGSTPLGSKFGLAADNVLEWEVVTADGRQLTATPTKNSDLYWALSGGGGGTYAAVLSMTVRLHKNMKTAGATLQFVDTTDAFWKVLADFLVNIPAVIKAGASIYWQVIPPAYTGLPGHLFNLPQLYFPGGNGKELEKLMKPTFDSLKKNGIQYAYTTKDYNNFQDAFSTLNPYQNITEINIGGRLIPKSLVSNKISATLLADSIKFITNTGGIFAGVSADVSKTPNVDNSANPEWRKSAFLAFYGIPYDRTNFATNLVSQQAVTNVLTPALEKLTPGGGAYLNEADPNQRNWQTVFYGPINYAKLFLIKKKYDPLGIFWGPTTVGSEAPVHIYSPCCSVVNMHSGLVFSLLLAGVSAGIVRERNPPTCRSAPGDPTWPSQANWNSLNSTVNGRLIATIPIGASCHTSFISPLTGQPVSTYNAAQCAALRNTWHFPETHIENPSSPMAYTATSNSCNPFSAASSSCTIGNHAVYAIDAVTTSDLQAGINFARQHNLRIVIKNTGHDYLGKSTGAHSLSLWTHNFKTKQVINNYVSATYSGAAIKLGAGVLGIEAFRFANEHNLVVVGGNCPTVGIAGGYAQGGGIGPLSSVKGLATEQVLAWEVITAAGDLVIADPSNNANLYWALRGGGGGTYGLVVSMTVKAYPDSYTASSVISVAQTATNIDAIYAGFKQWMVTELPKLVDEGIYVLWILNPTGFIVQARFAFGKHQAELDALMQPTLAILNGLNLSPEYFSFEAPSFLRAYEDSPGGQWNVSDFNTGGRLVPRSLVNSSNSSEVDALVSVFRHIGTQTLLTGVCFNVSSFVSYPDENAVNPYFRTSLFNVFLGIPTVYDSWQANLDSMNTITNDFLAGIAALTPNGGAYLNEADVQQPNWQSVFYGSHWTRLSAIKRQYDPNDAFYAPTAVGSERWEERQDGRLCRV